jgi:hypothetical protein
VDALKRMLYLQAAAWAVAGMALAIAPRFTLLTVFGQPEYREYAWIRLVGIQAFGLAMFMVLVGHQVQELWWWSWAFALITIGTAAVVLLNAAFGLAPGQSTVLWWIFSVVGVTFAFGLLYGLFAASRERPDLLA